MSEIYTGKTSINIICNSLLKQKYSILENNRIQSINTLLSQAEETFFEITHMTNNLNTNINNNNLWLMIRPISDLMSYELMINDISYKTEIDMMADKTYGIKINNASINKLSLKFFNNDTINTTYVDCYISLLLIPETTTILNDILDLYDYDTPLQYIDISYNSGYLLQSLFLNNGTINDYIEIDNTSQYNNKFIQNIGTIFITSNNAKDYIETFDSTETNNLYRIDLSSFINMKPNTINILSNLYNQGVPIINNYSIYSVDNYIVISTPLDIYYDDLLLQINNFNGLKILYELETPITKNSITDFTEYLNITLSNGYVVDTKLYNKREIGSDGYINYSNTLNSNNISINPNSILYIQKY